MLPLTPIDVQRALFSFDPYIKIITFEESTATSELAAAAIGCDVSQIAKSICMMVEDKPVVAITSGNQRVDDRKIAAYFQVGRKRVRMATAEECVTLFGYAPGGVPPFGHRDPQITKLLDATLQQHETVYPAAGSANTVFAITPARLAELTGSSYIDFVREAAS
jgi:prolyl-tRNA editing enzyme YbaK/EbsC (Cys-tRNA(Pro) deacylase)